MGDMGEEQKGPTTVFCDNNSAIALTKKFNYLRMKMGIISCELRGGVNISNSHADVDG